MNIEAVNTADRFIRFMDEIWSMDSKPVAGGMVIRQHPHYERYHDAIKVIAICGVWRTGGTRFEGEWSGVYRFPAGDGVVIKPDGSAVRRARRAVK